MKSLVLQTCKNNTHNQNLYFHKMYKGFVSPFLFIQKWSLCTEHATTPDQIKQYTKIYKYVPKIIPSKV